VPVGFDVVSNCYLRDVSVRIKGCWLALSDGVEGTGEWKGKETLLEEFAIRAFERGLEEGMAWHGEEARAFCMMLCMHILQIVFLDPELRIVNLVTGRGDPAKFCQWRVVVVSLEQK
jgi:hypothetical protein